MIRDYYYFVLLLSYSKNNAVKVVADMIQYRRTMFFVLVTALFLYYDKITVLCIEYLTVQYRRHDNLYHTTVCTKVALSTVLYCHLASLYFV